MLDSYAILAKYPTDSESVAPTARVIGNSGEHKTGVPVPLHRNSFLVGMKRFITQCLAV